MSWDYKKSVELYGINEWGRGYFGVNKKGNVIINPEDGKELDLYELTNDLIERGVRPPILIRFPDIVKKRIELLSQCFANSIKESNYQGTYSGVYPIKVNQQKHLVDEIVSYGSVHRLGLECGSKPELLIALSVMKTPNALIICNGFKDSEYIETALLSQKLGRQTFIVVDRMKELELIINASKKLNIQPKIGFRTKLDSKGGGKWVESSGARSKFGLTPTEMVLGVNKLKEEGMLDSLQLLHFHIGSQIPSIQYIKASMKEGAQVFSEMYRMGAPLKYIDVGGGLGVDYDGSGSSDSSMNYEPQDYANDVVNIIQNICAEKEIPHPHIITESGRSLVAHTSILVFDVLGKNQVAKSKVHFDVDHHDSRIVQEMYEMYSTVNSSNANEFYNDLIEKKRDSLQMFTYGVLSLEQRAKVEDLYWSTLTKIYPLMKEIDEEIFWEIEKNLSDTYFCNFSVFQSLPDSWAIGQHFPVMPIHKLNEKPTKQATIADLTCDSDGKIDNFYDNETSSTQSYLEVHPVNPDEPYYLAAFLTGAYQEILGDLHNLFGDTDAVHISIHKNGYNVDHVVVGDSVSEVLSYLEYNKSQLIENIRLASENSIAAGVLTRQESKLLMKHYEEGLSGYTYLE